MGMRKTTNNLTLIGVFGALTIALSFTPLGLIPLGIINATTLHIPVIIAAVIGGPFIGSMVGLIFGLSSMLRAIMAPTVMTPFLLNPLISILPRVLIGVVAGYSYRGLKKISPNTTKILSYIIWIICLGFSAFIIIKNIGGSTKSLVLGIILFLISAYMLYYTHKKLNYDFPIAASALLGSLTNTLIFLTNLYIFYGERYMESIGRTKDAAKAVIGGIAITSGIPEAIVAVIIATPAIRTILNTRKDK